MNWRKIGVALILLGLFLGLSGSITGAAIGFSKVSSLNLLGIFVFVLGVVLVMAKRSSGKSQIEEIADKLAPGRQEEFIKDHELAHNKWSYDALKRKLGYSNRVNPEQRREIRQAKIDVGEYASKNGPPSPRKDWVTLYHASPRRSVPYILGYPEGLIKREKAFYMAEDPSSAAEYLTAKYNPVDINTLTLEVQKDVLNRVARLTSDQGPGHTGKNWKIPIKNIELANQFFNKGYIRLKSHKKTHH